MKKYFATLLKNSMVKWILGIAIILFILFILLPWIKRNYAVLKAKIKSANWGKNRVTDPDTDRVINLDIIAAGINDAFYNNDWFGYTEDEEKAIALLLQVPKKHISRLAQVYANLGKSLYEDFREYLNDEEYARIAHLFE